MSPVQILQQHNWCAPMQSKVSVVNVTVHNLYWLSKQWKALTRWRFLVVKVLPLQSVVSLLSLGSDSHRNHDVTQLFYWNCWQLMWSWIFIDCMDFFFRFNISSVLNHNNRHPHFLKFDFLCMPLCVLALQGYSAFIVYHSMKIGGYHTMYIYLSTV